MVVGGFSILCFSRDMQVQVEVDSHRLVEIVGLRLEQILSE